jgi:hypothetical protein
MLWTLAAEPGIAEDASASFHRRINLLLRVDERIFVVKRSGLRKEFGGSRSGADDRVAQL